MLFAFDEPFLNNCRNKHVSTWNGCRVEKVVTCCTYWLTTDHCLIFTLFLHHYSWYCILADVIHLQVFCCRWCDSYSRLSVQFFMLPADDKNMQPSPPVYIVLILRCCRLSSLWIIFDWSMTILEPVMLWNILDHNINCLSDTVQCILRPNLLAEFYVSLLAAEGNSFPTLKPSSCKMFQAC
jgi:hypothetical protein